MKNITRIFSLVVILVMALSVACYAADFAHTFTVTTDVTSVSAGDTVTVTVDLAGPMTDVAMVQMSIVYDTAKFSVNTATDRTKGYKCFDAAWYAPLKATADGSEGSTTDNLGYISKPTCGENPKGTVNLGFISTDGYYIDNGSDLYGKDATVTAAKIIFTATADVDKIDSTCFNVINAKVDDASSKHSTVTVNQIKAADPEPSVKTITKTEDAIVNNATALKDKETDVEIGGAAGFAFTIPAGVKLDDNMIWSLTTADGKLYSEKINAGLSTLGEGSPVKVAATFVTGTHKGADAANKEITAVNGIFKAGEDFYFTDAADAKNQAAAAE